MGNHKDPDIIEQMKRKHPARKKEITKMTETEMGMRRKKISRAVFDAKMK